MSTKVVEHLAARYEMVKEGVKSVMGGKILEYEAKTIYREGMREGEQIGREQNLLDLIERKMMKGQSVEQMAEALEETPERIQEMMRTLSQKKA